MSKLKGPLILTLVVIVVRIILEEMGAPGAVTNILGVFWLAVIFAIYFAIGLAASGEAHPYKALIKLIIGYGVGARLMVAISYSLAYALDWSAPRFGAPDGEEVTALQGLLLAPLSNFVLGLIMVVVAGLVVGPVTLAIRRKMVEPQAAEPSEEAAQAPAEPSPPEAPAPEAPSGE